MRELKAALADTKGLAEREDLVVALLRAPALPTAAERMAAAARATGALQAQEQWMRLRSSRSASKQT